MGTTFCFTLPEGSLPEAADPILKKIKAELAEIPRGQTSVSIELTSLHGERRVTRHVKHGYSFYCDASLLSVPEWILALTEPEEYGIEITEMVYREVIPYVESLAPYLGEYGAKGESNDNSTALVDLVTVAGSPVPGVSIRMVLRPNLEGRYKGCLPVVLSYYAGIRSRDHQPHTWYQPRPAGLS